MKARVLAAAVLTAAAVLVPFPASAASSAFGATADSVTLITGDRVELMPTGEPRFVPTPDRKAVRYRTTRIAGHLNVVPIDAVPLIAAGRLDPRLFDVTALRDAGYGDDESTDLGLIVRYANGTRAAGLHQERALPSVRGAAVTTAKKDTATLWQSLREGRAGVDTVWLNGLRQPTLDQSVPQIGAPAAWQAGLTGAGVLVAVLDTGIDANHPDLAGKVVEAKNFTAAPDGDQIGHGTHVASTIASGGQKYRGVAPDARLLDGKVCEDSGCYDDAVLAGMEWAATRAPVVNMSLGGQDGPGIDPLEAAVDELSAAHGTLFVIAAGNAGPYPTSIDSPGSADAALTVGAVDRTDTLADFSSRGPRAGDGGLKPDVTAPGVGIVAAQATGTELGTPTGDGHVAASGTSMATPHVAGAAAILRQRHPDWTGERLKAALMSSAKPMGAAYDYGAGRVDVARAVSQAVTATPVNVSFGLVQWPHEDDSVSSRTVTYRNDGPAEVVLDVAAPAPFTVTPSSVPVPAGGTAEVTISVDTRSAEVPLGRHSGQVVASAARVSVSTPVAVEKESERYEVSLTHIGRDGGTPALHVTYLDRVGDCGDDPTCGGYVAGDAATDTLRLPPGEYALGDFSSVDGTDSTLLIRPSLDLRADTTLVLDARTTKPVDIRAPKGEALAVDLVVGVNLGRPNSDIAYTAGTAWDQPPLNIGTLPGSPQTRDRVYSLVNAKFAEPGPTGDFMDSPYVYNLAKSLPNKVFDGVELAPAPREFAKVEASYAAPGNGPRRAQVDHSGKAPDSPAWLLIPPGGATLQSSTLPFRRDEYYLADGLQWWTALDHRSDAPRDVLSLTTSAKRSVYQAGRTYQVEWNRGVLGPKFDTPNVLSNGLAQGVVRTGDDLAVGLITTTDATHIHDPRTPLGASRLLRDGTVVAEWPQAGYARTTLPPEAATYQLEHTAHSGVEISTEVTSRWTFRSAHTSSATPLPLMSIRFTPALDDHNHARSGRFEIPVSVQRQPGTDRSTVSSPTVEVSYDDGTTWRPARVDDGKVHVDNPKGGTVSLRAMATDRAGNKVEQTILRAYLVS